jgi:hypothetical protein
LRGLLVEATEDDSFETAGVGQFMDDSDGNLGGAPAGKTVDTGGDGRKSDGFDVVDGGEFQAAPAAGGQRGRFAVGASAPDRTYGMEDPFCG